MATPTRMFARPARSALARPVVLLETREVDLVLASLPAGAAAARRPRCQGQAQLKAGTSSTWRMGELQLAAVRGGQPPGDVQTRGRRP